jgi:cytochrome c oxidase subunit I+III
VKIGDHVTVPATARGRASPTWWAMVVLLAVDATVFASLAFAHVHVSMALDVCPPPGAQVPDGGTWVVGLLLAASGCIGWAVRALAPAHPAGDRPRQWGLRVAVLLATLASIGAFGLDLGLHLQAGLAPSANAWSATVAALLAWQGLHAAILLLMGGYLLARSFAGALRDDARASLDNCALMWHYVSAQGLLALGLVRLLPQWMGS